MDERAEKREPLLRVRDVAWYLGLAANTIHHMCRQARIPHLKISGLIRFDPDEFQRWVAEHRRGYPPRAWTAWRHDPGAPRS